MQIRLSKRMKALAMMVTEGHRLADVGTDHGYIPIFLVQTGRIPAAIAMDVNEGPLRCARENVSACRLETKIELRLSDGLAKLRPGETDTVLTAGMGGFLMRRILQDGEAVLATVKQLVLQPQSEIPEVRKFLREHGFSIMDEDMVKEDGKYYPMMKAQRGFVEAFYTGQEELCDVFGPILLQKKNPVLLEWMGREEKLLEKIAKQLSGQEENEKIRLRKCEIEQKQALLASAYVRMRGYQI